NVPVISGSQSPCTSGWPSDRRAGCHGCWPDGAPGNIQTRAAAASAVRRLRVVLLDIEGIAGILQKLKVLFLVPVQHQAHRPGAGEDLGVLDRHVVVDVIGTV